MRKVTVRKALAIPKPLSYNDVLKWPMDPTAPDVQNAIAETWDQMNITKKPGTAEHDAIASKALDARTALAHYIGNTPWVDANKDNPEALATAERLVKGGLQAAAATHTNQAVSNGASNGGECFVVPKGTPAIATQASAGSVGLNNPVSDAVTVSGNPTPTGAVTFFVCS